MRRMTREKAVDGLEERFEVRGKKEGSGSRRNRLPVRPRRTSF